MTSLLAPAGPIESRFSLRKGDYLYRQGDDPRGVFELVAGMIALLVSTPGGQEIALAIIRPGEIFGGLEVVLEIPRIAGAAVWTDLAIVRPVKDVPLIATALQELKRASASQSRLAALLATPLASRRLARALSDFPEGATLLAPQHEIGSLAGIQRETTSRAIGDLAARGLITRLKAPRQDTIGRLAPGGIRIVDPDGLLAFAEGGG